MFLWGGTLSCSSRPSKSLVSLRSPGSQEETQGFSGETQSRREKIPVLGGDTKFPGGNTKCLAEAKFLRRRCRFPGGEPKLLWGDPKPAAGETKFLGRKCKVFRRRTQVSKSRHRFLGRGAKFLWGEIQRTTPLRSGSESARWERGTRPAFWGRRLCRNGAASAGGGRRAEFQGDTGLGWPQAPALPWTPHPGATLLQARGTPNPRGAPKGALQPGWGLPSRPAT